MKHKKLVKTLSQICYYAQDHISDPEVWPTETFDREKYFECTSHTIACFLAQNTVRGDEGVDSNIVLDHLVDRKKNRAGFMIQTEKRWEKIIERLVDCYGGVKRCQKIEKRLKKRLKI